MKMPIKITGSIELDINLVEVIDQSLKDSVIQAEYYDFWELISNKIKYEHNPGNRYMAVWVPKYPPRPDWIVGFACNFVSLMSIVIDGKTFKARHATIEELVCYRISKYESIDIDLIALGEVAYIDSDRNHCYAFNYTRYKEEYKEEVPKRHLDAACPGESWSSLDGFLIVFEEVAPDQM